MTVGAGFSASGFSPAGTGDVDQPAVPTGNLLKDAKGASQNARQIDPATRQYVVDSTGALAGMNGVSQMVLLRLMTLKNSSTIPGFGKNAPPKDMGSNITQRISADVRDALNDMVAARLILINAISVLTSTSTQVTTYVKWTDLTDATNGGEQLTNL